MAVLHLVSLQENQQRKWSDEIDHSFLKALTFVEVYPSIHSACHVAAYLFLPCVNDGSAKWFVPDPCVAWWLELARSVEKDHHWCFVPNDEESNELRWTLTTTNTSKTAKIPTTITEHDHVYALYSRRHVCPHQRAFPNRKSRYDLY